MKSTTIDQSLITKFCLLRLRHLKIIVRYREVLKIGILYGGTRKITYLWCVNSTVIFFITSAGRHYPSIGYRGGGG